MISNLQQNAFCKKQFNYTSSVHVQNNFENSDLCRKYRMSPDNGIFNSEADGYIAVLVK